jgi:catechol 2,3-dioxygenase
VVAPGLGAPLEFFFEIDKPLAPPHTRSKLPSNSAKFTPCGVRRIDHINLATALDELGPAETWVRDALGFKRREALRLPDGGIGASWLSVTPQVHDLAITADEGGRTGRLNHLAFNLEEFADINRLADVLADHDIHVDISPGRHGITQGHFYYVREPGSGHRIELFSGGYLIFDPDWAPIEWTVPELSDYGLKWVGPPEWTRETNLNGRNTPATAPDAIGVAAVE